jgi:hypothetical protein
MSQCNKHSLVVAFWWTCPHAQCFTHILMWQCDKHFQTSQCMITRSTIFCIRTGRQHEALKTEVDEHVCVSHELQMHLEERCMLEGNSNGLDVDNLACVRALHSNGKLCMQMCQTSIIWLMYQSNWSTEGCVWHEYMCV